MAKFGQIVVIYFMMGVIVWGGGVVDFSQTGLVGSFVEVNESTGDVGANNTSIVAPGEEDNSGILENLLGPVKEALDTVAGGGVISAFQAVDRFLGFFAWPVTTTKAINAPREAVALSGVLVVSFVFGAIRIIRSSV